MATFHEGNTQIRQRKNVAEERSDTITGPHGSEKDEFGEDSRKKILQSPYCIQNVIWLISAIGVFYWTDFARVALYDSRIHETWFNIGALLIAINLMIAFFLIVYLSVIKKVKSDDWDVRYPAAIPIATASFAFGSFCLTIALWPVWGVLTLPVLFVQFMGVVVVIAMLPDF